MSGAVVICEVEYAPIGSAAVVALKLGSGETLWEKPDCRHTGLSGAQVLINTPR